MMPSQDESPFFFTATDTFSDIETRGEDWSPVADKQLGQELQRLCGQPFQRQAANSAAAPV